MAYRALNNLTPRQRQAYVMRFRWGWRLAKIASELGITAGAACALVKRAQFRAGLGKQRVRVIRGPRAVMTPALARSFERDGGNL